MLTRRTLLAPGLRRRRRRAARRTPGRGRHAAGIVVMAKQIDDIITFDPAESYEFTDNEVDANFYRKLVSPDLERPQQDRAATSRRAGRSRPDGKTFTFHLKQDAHLRLRQADHRRGCRFSLRRVVTLNLTPGFILTQFGFTKDNVAQLIRATDAAYAGDRAAEAGGDQLRALLPVRQCRRHRREGDRAGQRGRRAISAITG